MLAGFGSSATTVPRRVRQLAGRTAVRVVWVNELGGVTCEYGEGQGRRFVKWSPAAGPDLTSEAERLAWAAPFTPVPQVVEAGGDDDGTWLVSLPLPGTNAVSPRWAADPATACRAIGEGLRSLHDALPVAACPFSWEAARRVAEAHERAGAGLLDPVRWHASHRGLSVDDALRRLDDVPDVDQRVVCHGDSCAPNTLIGDDGRWTGHVDLGQLGTGDRWADLAIATWSTEWNYGPGWERAVLDAYEIGFDADRTRYYRLLWDLGP